MSILSRVVLSFGILIVLFGLNSCASSPLRQKPYISGQDDDNISGPSRAEKSSRRSWGRILDTTEIPCASDDDQYLHMVSISDKLKFHWKLDVWSDNTAPKVSFKLEYDGNAWIGLGFSNWGTMIGSQAVIGRPALAAADGEKPLKYNLNKKDVDGVNAMPQEKQTLIDSSISQSGGKTVLKFTKLLEEDGEVYIKAAGHTTFLFAIGEGNTLARHKEKGVFHVDLSRCEEGTVIGAGSHKAAWVAHGTFATLAWAIATPFAVATAWFRTLVPSSWIYIHVAANALSFLFTFIAFLVAVITMSVTQGKQHFSGRHHIVGLCLMLLITVQVLNGFLRPPVERKSDSSSVGMSKRSPRQLWYLVHSTLGVAMVGLGLYQVSDGYNFFSNEFAVTSLAPFYYVYLSLIVLAMVGLKVWMLYEEYQAEKNNTSGAVSVAPEQQRMREEAANAGIDHKADLVPIDFSIE